MEAVSLTGITSVQMLLKIGLDKVKKDYVSFFIGQELATLTSLDCFISTSVDLQEQVHCVQKLHHMLEIMVSCTVLLQFKHESLFPWTQICIKYYRENPPDEKHVFQLPVSSALVKKFYPDSHPEVWKVDISSGHGPKEVKTTWQVSYLIPRLMQASKKKCTLLQWSSAVRCISDKCMFLCRQALERYIPDNSLLSCYRNTEKGRD
ncbi:protein zwilch homolog [Amazona ochrocephala]